MSTGDEDLWPLAYLLQDMLRLSNTHSPLLAVKPFDAAAWLAEFEALPGHSVKSYGPSYQDPEAWGHTITDEDFIVTDPALVAAENARIMAQHPECARDYARRSYFYAVERVTIERVFADDPAERHRRVALWTERQERQRQAPVGQSSWQALSDWQKRAVIGLAKARMSPK